MLGCAPRQVNLAKRGVTGVPRVLQLLPARRCRATLDPDGSETRPQTIRLDLQGVQVGQKILHLLRHDLAKGRHHIAAGDDHFSDALVIGRHSALRQKLAF